VLSLVISTIGVLRGQLLHKALADTNESRGMTRSIGHLLLALALATPSLRAYRRRLPQTEVRLALGRIDPLLVRRARAAANRHHHLEHARPRSAPARRGPAPGCPVGTKP